MDLFNPPSQHASLITWIWRWLLIFFSLNQILSLKGFAICRAFTHSAFTSGKQIFFLYIFQKSAKPFSSVKTNELYPWDTLYELMILSSKFQLLTHYLFPKPKLRMLSFIMTKENSNHLWINPGSCDFIFPLQNSVFNNCLLDKNSKCEACPSRISAGTGIALDLCLLCIF